MDFRDMQQARNALHDLPKAAIATLTFFGCFPVLGDQTFNGLRQRFVPLGQPFKSFVDGHPWSHNRAGPPDCGDGLPIAFLSLSYGLRR